MMRPGASTPQGQSANAGTAQVHTGTLNGELGHPQQRTIPLCVSVYTHNEKAYLVRETSVNLVVPRKKMS